MLLNIKITDLCLLFCLPNYIKVQIYLYQSSYKNLEGVNTFANHLHTYRCGFFTQLMLSLNNMKNISIIFLILMIVWVLLNNTFQLNILIPGAIIALTISLLMCRRCDIFAEMKFTPKSIAYTFIYLGIFFVDLLKSNMDVTRRVLSPSLPIKPGIVEVKTKLKSKFARMLLANSITLTPGTLTVDVKEDSFFIHWIDVEDDEIEKASKKIVEKFEKYLEVIYG